MSNHLVLTLSCPDRPGLVAAVGGFLVDHGFTIRDSQQYGDDETGLFFMRIHAAGNRPVRFTWFRAEFAPLAERLDMRWEVHDPSRRNRLLVMVSRESHCLNDLLHRTYTGSLHTDVAAVVSNHPDLAPLVERHGVPFHHVPVTAETKPDAEDKLRKLIARYDAETVVLARYMQILSDPLCEDLSGRAINIHHSLLPSFKGAKPYTQAHARGVKVVGATAHYVTGDLDEGPIIEQDFTRVDHTMSVADLTTLGKDLEALALARAVAAHSEHRVLVNGTKTVVFR